MTKPSEIVNVRHMVDGVDQAGEAEQRQDGERAGVPGRGDEDPGGSSNGGLPGAGEVAREPIPVGARILSCPPRSAR